MGDQFAGATLLAVGQSSNATIFSYLRAAAPAADPGKIGPRFFDPPPCFFDPPPCLFEALATIVWILYIYICIYIYGPYYYT